MCGDPDLETTTLVIAALGEAGADAIELGIPYSDPLADGPTIAAAGARALDRGTSLESVLELVRMAQTSVPIILFTYYNPIYQYGVDRFAHAAAGAGAAGVIVPDVTLEETKNLQAALAAHELEMPLLIAPSTPAQRARAIAEESGGFVYVVSRLGVTGVAVQPDFGPLRQQLTALRAMTKKPLAVGFGISSRTHVDAVRDVADGVVVGSALIESYAGACGKAAAEKARNFIRTLR